MMRELIARWGNIPKEHARVAYTIDGRQPVTSPIIGDEPLYYFDDPRGLQN